MSYQQFKPAGEVHRLNEYIPTYVPHSEYLPTNRVLDANQPEAQKWVFHALRSWPIMSSKNDLVMSTLNVPLNSTLLAMFLSALSRMSLSTNPFRKQSSTAGSKEYD